jgi:hypothetical protein
MGNHEFLKQCGAFLHHFMVGLAAHDDGHRGTCLFAQKKAAARFLKFERRPYIFYAPFSFGKGPVPTLSR